MNARYRRQGPPKMDGDSEKRAEYIEKRNTSHNRVKPTFCKEEFEVRMSLMPEEGFKSYQTNLKRWVHWQPHDYIYEPCRYIDDKHFVPYHVKQFFRQQRHLSADQKKYKLPTRIENDLSSEIYSCPKILKYRPELEPHFRKIGILGVNDKYEADVSKYDYQHHYKAPVIPEILIPDDAEDPEVLFDQVMINRYRRPTPYLKFH